MKLTRHLKALLGLVMVGGFFLPANDGIQGTGGSRRHSMTKGQYKKYRHNKRIVRRSRQVNARK